MEFVVVAVAVVVVDVVFLRSCTHTKIQQVKCQSEQKLETCNFLIAIFNYMSKHMMLIYSG